MEADRLFHGSEREQLHQVVLDHVAGRTDAVVVAPASPQADVFGHGDLHVVDIVGIPDRVEQLVGESHREDVLHRLFTQVVVNAEHRLLGKDAVDHVVQLACTVQIVAERLLDDHPAPAAILGLGQPGGVQLLAHRGKALRRDRKVESMVTGGAACSVELVQRLGQPGECLVVVERALDEAAALGQPIPDHLSERCAGVIFYELVDLVAERLVVPVAAAEPDQRESRGQQAAVGQVVNSRHDLLARQIAGDTEDHYGARAGDPGEALIAFVPQWVLPSFGACPRVGRTHLDASLSCSCVASRSSFQDPSNFSTPSSSSTRNTSVRSTPTASSLSKTPWAADAVPVMVSPVTTPWSATASIVFSGMVFTVFGATSSVT